MSGGHADGTPCKEGLRQLPDGFTACCSSFDFRTKACHYDIRFEWWEKQNMWVVICADGIAGVEIEHCPFCGKKLSE
jgi:hypothetical protein